MSLNLGNLIVKRWGFHLMQSKLQLLAGIFGEERTELILLEDKMFNYQVKIGEEEKEIGKLSIKYLLELDSKKEFPTVKEEVQKNLRPSKKPRDRYLIPWETLIIGNSISLTLMEGEKIEGYVLFSGRYDILLALDEFSWIWVFKHAVVDSKVVKQSEVVKFYPDEKEVLNILDQEEPLTVDFIYLLAIIWNNNEREKIEEKVKKKLKEIPLGEKMLSTLCGKERLKKNTSAKGKKQEKQEKEVLVDLKVELEKETERTMVNAKLKIVFKQLPTEIKEVGENIWIACLNQPKGVPGKFSLPDTPLELLITKKMWKNAQKKADKLFEETEISPIRVIEALIGFKDNKLMAIASSVQVMPGKKKEKQ